MRIVGVSTSVNLPLHHKVQKFSSGTGSPAVVPEKGPLNGCVCVCVCVSCPSDLLAHVYSVCECVLTYKLVAG